ncbi:hypothetical protein [Prosthecobacter sp.]|uniref:hypothetical protein n=1 Tax=Prosthecobacter sp. TaxID=1965333 RepID=UPI001DD28068|nr:hypothetical protein [Prosthecobacter sp.]MCB1276161.1 hypothetical protein [Prosthecobacter sp.]
MSFEIDQPDPAAVFACAVSLRDACEQNAERHGINLSEVFHGGDQFWRKVMRIATLFENWACENVAFEALDHVWPYLLEAKFGDACLAHVNMDGLITFDAMDCLVVAMGMNLPLWYRDGFKLPLDLTAANPVQGSSFVRWRIQTVRRLQGEEDMEPMCYGDDPHDADYEPPVLALYGIDADGLLEHIRDSATYAEVRSLASNLAPGVAFPERPMLIPAHARLDE